MSELKNMELNEQELETAAGGCDGMDQVSCNGYVAGLKEGYLAVRTSPRAGADNQIGGLLNGQPVTILPDKDGDYIMITAYCGKTAWTNETGYQTGWVNKNYIVRR